MKSSLPSYFALLNHFAAIRVYGPNVAIFLQGQTTCDIRQVKENQGLLGACSDTKGRMIANFFVVCINTDYFLLLPQNSIENLLHHLKKYAVLSRVELLPAPEWKIIEYRGAKEFTDKDVFMFSFPRDSQWLMVPTDQEMKITDKLGTITNALSLSNWENLNIDSGLVWLNPKTSGLFIPQMINWQKWNGVSFTKGCYIGQEIIARTEHLGQLKRHLYHSEISSTEKPTVGNEIKKSDGQTIGIIVAAGLLPEKKYKLLAVIQDGALSENVNPTVYLHATEQHNFIADATTEIKSHHGWMRCS